MRFIPLVIHYLALSQYLFQHLPFAPTFALILALYFSFALTLDPLYSPAFSLSPYSILTCCSYLFSKIFQIRLVSPYK